MIVFFVFLFSIMELNFQERLPELHDWATILFVIAFILIAINRSVFANRFFEFSNLAFSDKYLKIYKDGNSVTNSFTISMFIVQLISFSFFLQLAISQFRGLNKNDGILYLQVFSFLMVFILSKYLIDKIIAVTFHIEDFVEQFNLFKVSYRTYFGFILLPINMILYYNNIQDKWVYISLAVILFLFNLLTYAITLKKYQNLLTRKMFYFILYLCTLEMTPYYFIYYWVAKN